MNILMIYPEFPDTFWSFKHALRFVSRRASSQPLGLITVASMLPKEWNKRLVDVNVRLLTDEDLSWADYVFLGGMIVQRESARASSPGVNKLDSKSLQVDRFLRWSTRIFQKSIILC